MEGYFDAQREPEEHHGRQTVQFRQGEPNAGDEGCGLDQRARFGHRQPGHEYCPTSATGALVETSAGRSAPALPATGPYPRYARDGVDGYRSWAYEPRSTGARIERKFVAAKRRNTKKQSEKTFSTLSTIVKDTVKHLGTPSKDAVKTAQAGKRRRSIPKRSPGPALKRRRRSGEKSGFAVPSLKKKLGKSFKLIKSSATKAKKLVNALSTFSAGIELTVKYDSMEARISMGPRSDDSTTPAITFATPKRAISSGIDRTLPKPSFTLDESCDVSETFHTPKGGPCESRQDTPRPYQEARFQDSVFSRDSSPGKSKFLKSQSSKQPF
ncbi:unnamed protein product [Oikopleura dioica]|uniref:Uncharacterized protein n=1 Tax=Oikopleura dioica TaxID=34765 RepID=E4XCJ0_OIKDI|nr:unnamed protein product [Oikopleura dioica]